MPIYGIALWTLLAAQPATVWKSGSLKAYSQKLSGKGNIAGKSLGRYGNHSTAVWHREGSGQAELHKNKTDLIVIETGQATLLYGGTIPKARTTAPGEIRGATIAGGTSEALAPGDLVHIPPNTPHQFLIEKGKEITYFVVKID